MNSINQLTNITDLLNIINTSLWLYVTISIFIFFMWLYSMYSTIRTKNMIKDICKMLEMQVLLINKIDDKLKNIENKTKAEEEKTENI